MKKKILIITIIAGIFILIIGTSTYLKKDDKYYQSVSDLVVGFFNSSNYSKDDFDAGDIDAIENYLAKLTHKNEYIDLSEYIIKERSYYTNSSNTSGVFKKDGKCYIEYKDLDFDKPVEEENYEMEPYKKVVCDKYFTILYASMFYPNYEITKNNPKYDYQFVSSVKTQTGYEYKYYSTYDGTGLLVKLNIIDKHIHKIEVEFLGKES